MEVLRFPSLGGHYPLKLFYSPHEEFFFEGELREKIGRLRALPEKENRFLLVCGDNISDSITWILAAFYSGFVAVPLPNDSISKERATTHFKAETFYFTSEIPIAPFFRGELELQDFEKIWAVIFSSGTTGEPKAIAFTGAALKSAAESHQAHLNPAGIWLLNIPLYHIGGLSIITRALFLHGSIALSTNKFDVGATWNWLESGAVSGVSLVPTTLFRLLKVPGKRPKNLRIALLGGAPANDDLLAEAAERGFPVFRTYGMTESCSQIATEKKPASGLIPLAGVNIRIAPDKEIHVSASFLAAGTFVSGELKPLSMEKSLGFPTGDLGEFDSTLKVLGRKKDMIISGGLNIFPQEIESLLELSDGLEDFAVCGISDREWGEIVCAAYVTNNPAKLDEWKNRLANKIEKRKMPKFWLQVPAIPRTETGKLKRLALREIIEKSFSKT